MRNVIPVSYRFIFECCTQTNSFEEVNKMIITYADKHAGKTEKVEYDRSNEYSMVLKLIYYTHLYSY